MFTKNTQKKIFTPKIFTQKKFAQKIFTQKNFTQKIFNQKIFTQIVRLSFVDLRWAQLYVSLVIISVRGTVCSSDVSLAPNWLFSGSRQCMMRRGKIPSDTHHRENQTWTESANSRCAGPKPNGTRACDGYRSSKYDDLSKMKKDDDQKKPRVPLPSRADADALRTCWRCLARITLGRPHKRCQTHLVSVGGTLWGWGIWMNELARQPAKLLWFKADYVTLAGIS